MTWFWIYLSIPSTILCAVLQSSLMQYLWIFFTFSMLSCNFTHLKSQEISCKIWKARKIFVTLHLTPVHHYCIFGLAVIIRLTEISACHTVTDSKFSQVNTKLTRCREFLKSGSKIHSYFYSNFPFLWLTQKARLSFLFKSIKYLSCLPGVKTTLFRRLKCNVLTCSVGL